MYLDCVSLKDKAWKMHSAPFIEYHSTGMIFIDKSVLSRYDHVLKSYLYLFTSYNYIPAT